MDDTCEEIYRDINLCNGMLDGFIIADDKHGDFTWETKKILFPQLKGAGLEGDPYHLENLQFDGELENITGVLIVNSNATFIVDNCTFENYGLDEAIPTASISLYYSENITVNFTTFLNCGIGQYCFQVNQSRFNHNTYANSSIGFLCEESAHLITENNTFLDLEGFGAAFSLGDNNTFHENWVQNCSYAGLMVNNEPLMVTNNTFIKNGKGIDNNGNNLTVISNYIAQNVNCGLNSTSGDNLWIEQNTFTQNMIHGMYLKGNSHTILDNKIIENQESGIYLSFTDQVLVRLNNVSYNNDRGIHCLESTNCEISANIIEHNGFYGIYADESTIDWIRGNIITNHSSAALGESSMGFASSLYNCIDGSFNNDFDIVNSATFTHEIDWEDAIYYLVYWTSGSGTAGDPYRLESITNTQSITISFTNAHVILDNVTIQGSVTFYQDDNCAMMNSNVSQNIGAFAAKNINITSCIVNKLVFDGQDLVGFVHDLFIFNNTIHEKIELDRCYDFNISENTIESGYISIFDFEDATPIPFSGVISNNTINGDPIRNGVFINLDDTQEKNVLIENNYFNDIGRWGINGRNANGFNFTNNHFENCTLGGIMINNSDTIYILDNEMIDNSGDGVALNNCTNTIIRNNTISGNQGHGIFLDVLTNTTLVYYNHISDNTVAQAYDNGSANNWDNGTHGNYYGDYREIYPTTLNDGTFWLQSYDINGTASSMDNHPLCGDQFPEADFSVNATNISQGEYLNFTYTGYQGNYNATFLWDFGDGSTSTQQNPIYQFASGGSYLVRLTITDADGDVATSTIIIEVAASGGPNITGYTPALLILIASIAMMGISFRKYKKRQ